MQIISTKNLDVSNMTKGALPGVPFVELKDKILGKKYDLSISFVGPAKMASLSQTYKGDPTHKNILSFPLSNDSGEIVLNFAAIKKEAPNFGHSAKKHLYFLVIHGMLHLAGHRHGSKMESTEKRLLAKYF